MKKQIATALLIIIMALAVAGAFNIEVKASKTLVVPTDYSTIAEAVNHATSGDVIFVKEGVYNENLQINTSISLQGEDSANTIIVGSGGNQTNAVLTLAANGIKVSGFTIESQSYPAPTYYAYGILVNADRCEITGNFITSTYIGIFSSVSSSTAITDNTITGSVKDGVRFFGGSLNTISQNNITANGVSGISINGYSDTITGNTLQNNFRGIGLGASYSVVFNNTMAGNAESGIWLAGSNNIIAGNAFSENKWGIYITSQLAAPRENTIYSNNFLNNICNAYDSTSSLVQNWDNSAQTVGNYWSDYQTKYPNATQIGTSKIGNTPYTITTNNTDNYPLITPSSGTTMPSSISPPAAKPNSKVASWSFDAVDPDNVMPDATGNNPAVLGSVAGNNSYIPVLVAGQNGNALSFNGSAYAFVPPSPSLLTPNEVTIDAWINVRSIKGDVAYNNVIVECVRTTASLPTRTLGLAINGDPPENSSSPVLGALRGYVLTPSGLNEIDTTTAIPLNQWLHVVFTRSLTTGMHIYVNGQEQQVMVSSGVVNPSGPIQKQTEVYIGHDAIINIDNLQISNTVQSNTQPIWLQWWLWVAVVAVTASALIMYRQKYLHGKPSKQ